MKSRTLNRASFMRYLVTSAGVAALVTSMAATASAQEAEEETSVQETITVTGSRIPTDPNLASSVPVQSIDDSEIKLSGELNLADVVNDIPALVSSLTVDLLSVFPVTACLRIAGGAGCDAPESDLPVPSAAVSSST